MQSLLFWIFQVPVHFRPISLLRSTPSGRRLIRPMGAIGNVLPTTLARDFLFAKQFEIFLCVSG